MSKNFAATSPRSQSHRFALGYLIESSPGRAGLSLISAENSAASKRPWVSFASRHMVHLTQRPARPLIQALALRPLGRAFRHLLRFASDCAAAMMGLADGLQRQSRPALRIARGSRMGGKEGDIPYPMVSIVIPHFNDVEALTHCVHLLEEQTYPRNCFEIIVADNNSDCGIEAVRAAALTAKVVPAAIQGAGPARNAGVVASRGEILAFIDSDCLPDRDWLRNGVAALDDYDFVGGNVITTCREPGRPNAVEAFEMVFAFDFKQYIEKVGFTGTGNMFVSRAVFDAVGPFRSGVSEDIEWSQRARALDYCLGYAPNAVVCHPARREWSELKKRWARMLDERYLLACERRFGRTKWAVATLAMPFSVIPHAWRIMRSERLNRWQDRLCSIVILARMRIWRAERMFRLSTFGTSKTRAQGQ